MRLRTRSLLLLVACLALLGMMALVAACGGSEETTTTTAPATDTTASATDTTTATTEAKGGTMEVKGLVDNPGTLSVADLQAMTLTTITAEHPKKGTTEYTGVLLSDFMTSVGVQSGAVALDMAASDGYMGTVTFAELDPNAMIAIGDDGTLNAVMPGLEGKAWVSDIVSIEFK
jgi:hypothetical protein